MKHKDSDNIDLGLENLIKGESEIPVQVKTPLPEEKSIPNDDPLEKLFQEDKYQEILNQVEAKYETSPYHKLWWVRVQKKTKAVPEIFLLPLLDEVKALNDASLLGLIALIEKEFQSEVKSEPLFFTPEKESMLFESVSQAIHKKKDTNRLRLIFLILLLLVFCLILFFAPSFFTAKEAEMTEYVPFVEKPTFIEKKLARTNIGSFSSLLYEYEEKIADENVGTPITPTEEITVVPTIISKVTVNTESPIAPDDVRDDPRDLPKNDLRSDKDSEPGDYESTYEVISNTYVYSRPTLSAPPITRLAKGAIVVGRQKMSGFLRIESASGEKGFILLQDVTEKLVNKYENKNNGRVPPPVRVRPELYDDPFSKPQQRDYHDDEDL